MSLKPTLVDFKEFFKELIESYEKSAGIKIFKITFLSYFFKFLFNR
jgi:hypothetical protein